MVIRVVARQILTRRRLHSVVARPRRYLHISQTCTKMSEILNKNL